jgi:glycosyltransferase involved in cell wall biosynthesis
MVQKELIFDFTIPGLYNAGIRSWSLDLLLELKKSNLFQITILTPYSLSDLNQYGTVIVVPYFKYRVPILHRFLYYKFRFEPALKSFLGIPLLSPYFQLPKNILDTHSSIITIHDTLYYDLKKTYARPDFFILKTLTNFYHQMNLCKAKNILTVSEFTRGRLNELFGVKCLDIFYNVPDKMVRASNSRYLYFVYFGGWERRKRAKIAMIIANLILVRLKDVKFIVSGVSDIKLIKKYFNPDVLNRIVYKDRFSKMDMNYFLSNSFLSIYTSSFEGFGIPLLESQLYGVPVLIGDDLKLSPEIPLSGLIPINLNRFTKSSIEEIIFSLSAYSDYHICDNAEKTISKLKLHNMKFPKKLYDAI